MWQTGHSPMTTAIPPLLHAFPGYRHSLNKRQSLHLHPTKLSGFMTISRPRDYGRSDAMRFQSLSYEKGYHFCPAPLSGDVPHKNPASVLCWGVGYMEMNRGSSQATVSHNLPAALSVPSCRWINLSSAGLSTLSFLPIN